MGDREEVLPLVESKQRYRSFIKIGLICLNIALSSFYFGYNIVYLSTIKTQTLKTIYGITLSDGTTQGLLNGLIPGGALLGAIGSGLLISRFSRRNCLLIVNVYAIVAGIIIYIHNFYTLIFARISQGICVGFYSAAASLIIQQLAPTQISGTLGSFTQLMVCLGVFFGCIFQFIMSKITGDPSGNSYWEYEFGFPLLTLTLQSFILLFIFPYETPKYLLVNGKEEEARKLLTVIYKDEYVEEVLQGKKADLDTSETKRDSIIGKSILSCSLNAETRDTDSQVGEKKRSNVGTFVALHLAILQQLCGANAVVIYGGDIAGQAVPDLKNIMPSLINLVQLLPVFVTSYLLSKLGRKTILQFGALSEGIACGIIAVGFLIKDSSQGASKALVLTGLFLFMAIFGLTLGPVVWLYIPEIVEPKIVPFSTAANWISALLVIFLFPIITESVLNNNPGVLFFIFTAWCLVSFLLNTKIVVETKDKTERQIREEYKSIKLC